MFVHLVVYEIFKIYFMFYSVEYPLLPTKLYIFDSLRKITKLFKTCNISHILFHLEFVAPVALVNVFFKID